MASARDRLLKNKKAPSKEISLDEAISNGNTILNDPLSDPDLGAPKESYELSSINGEETSNSEDLENLMNMSPTGQKVFITKMNNAKQDKAIKDMFSKVGEVEEQLESQSITEESIESKNPMAGINKGKAALLSKMHSGISSMQRKEEIEPEPVVEEVVEEVKEVKEEPKIEDIELKSFSNVPDFKLNFDDNSLNENEEVQEENSVIEETTEEITEEVVEETKEEIKQEVTKEVKIEKTEDKVTEEPKVTKNEEKKSNGGSHMNAMEKMMERMMKRMAKQLIEEAQKQGVALPDSDPEETEMIYEFILEKLG